MDIDLNDTINKLDLIIMYRMLNLQIAKYTSFQGHTKLLQKKKKNYTLCNEAGLHKFQG